MRFAPKGTFHRFALEAMSSFDMDLSSAKERIADSRLFDAMQTNSAMHGADSEASSSMTFLIHSLVLSKGYQQFKAKAPISSQPQIENPLASSDSSIRSNMSDEEMAKHLIGQLGEKSMLLGYYKTLVQKLGASGVREVLHETELAISPGGSESAPTVQLQADKEARMRTTSGVFIKKSKAWIKRSEIKQRTKAESVKAAGIQLFQYQRDAIEKIMSLHASPETDKRRNLVVCAPTGSGKTMIFIEVSRRLLQSKPEAKIVVLVPTVALVVQQCAAFRALGFGGEESSGSITTTTPAEMFRKKHRVDSFCGGGNQLKADQWLNELNRLSVLVVESGSFKNLLEDGRKQVCLSRIDLLVLDECHHAKESHPYAVILRHYKELQSSSAHAPSPSSTSLDLSSSLARLMLPPPWKARYQKDPQLQDSDPMTTEKKEEGEIVSPQPPSLCRPRPPYLLGFSATPAGGKTDQVVRSKMNALLSLHDAELLIISEEHVKDVAPPPSEEKVEVEMRIEDVAFIQKLGVL